MRSVRLRSRLRRRGSEPGHRERKEQRDAGRWLARAEPLDELIERHRTRDVIALDQIASARHESIEGGLVLDTFGDDLEAERVSELDRRGHDRIAAAVAEHIRDEAAVDLQLLDGETTEVAER